MQMLKRGMVAASLAGLVMGLVVACGGGGGGTFAGIDRLGVTTGTVTGFGSIIVNGVHYEVSNQTAFDIDDSGSGTQEDLRVGQQVTIQWNSLDDGVTRRSTTVSYDDTLEGPITVIDLANQALLVLGQVVIADAATSFDDEIFPRDLSGLAVDQVIEISGFIDGNGAIRATRIDLSENTDDFEVRGIVESLDTFDSTFVINGLTVDYLDILDPPALANGVFVEVEGDTFDAGTLIATRVELEADGIPGADDGDDAEIEGYITRFQSATDFDVAGVRVTTVTGQTTYEDGVVGDLVLNVKVEVEGEVNSAGVLVAREVEFKSGDDDGDGDDDSIDGLVEGDVAAVNPGAGTMSIAGVAITVTASTRYEDQTGAVGQAFGLDDITVGDYVEVRGDPGVAATLTALIVERDDASPDGLLRGLAGAIDGVARTLTVLGVPVTTDGSTQYRDASDNALSAAAFFAAISNGSEVQVQFTQGAGPIVASELELEDLD